MYILVKDNFVFAGPNVWHPKLFASYIEDEFELEMTLPLTAPESGSNLGNDIFVYTVEQQSINFNNKIQKLDGPYYNYIDNKAIQYYNVVDKDLDHVKKELLEIVANNRWLKEIKGIDFTIQGNTIKLDTNRGSRDIYLQALQAGVDNNVWKFNGVDGNNVWLTISLAELQSIVTAIISHVQSVFDWEKLTADSINNATDLATLDAIDLGNPVVNTPLGV